MRFTWQVKGMHAAIDERRSPSGEAEAAIESCSADVCRAILHSRGSCGCFARDPQNGSRSDAGSAVRNGIDRQRRFDRREGHDLERLIWPLERGSGVSSGPLQNFAVDGRQIATVETI